jgi:hypothetical protein
MKAYAGLASLSAVSVLWEQVDTLRLPPGIDTAVNGQGTLSFERMSFCRLATEYKLGFDVRPLESER